jgi:hypothetical protein
MRVEGDWAVWHVISGMCRWFSGFGSWLDGDWMGGVGFCFAADV